MKPRSGRRTRRDLTIDEVVARALEIGAHEGEAGLTMRALADACGVAPNALYHHIGDKEHLLTLMVDHVVGGTITPLSDDESAWRHDLVEFACRYRAAILRHPVVASVYIRRPILSPNLARTTETLFEALRRGGFAGDAVAAAADAVVLLLIGSIANDLSRPPEVRRQLLGQLPDEAVPLLVEGIGAYADRDTEQRFRGALDALLDGLVGQFVPGV